MLAEHAQQIAAAVRDAKAPITLKQLEKQVRLQGAELRSALESASAANLAFLWPGRGQSFWSRSFDSAAREAILQAAAEMALPKKDLGKAAAKKLPGKRAKNCEALLSVLLAEGQLQQAPALSGRSKLLMRTGSPEAYFAAGRVFLEMKFRKAGFDPAPFFTQTSNTPDKIQGSAHQIDSAALILEAVRTLEPVTDVPVSTLRLRNHLPMLSKQEFDSAALELRKRQDVFLHLHADPHNLPQNERDLLIDGNDGTYFVAIAIR